MAKLFKDKDVLDVVSAKDVMNMTGISNDTFNFENEEDQEQAMQELIESWIKKIASHIYVRIDREVEEEDGDFLAIQDVLIRTVANLVAVAQQQRTSPVVQIDSFAINILNTTEVTKNLDKELKPFIRFKKGGQSGFASVFSSIYKGDQDAD